MSALRFADEDRFCLVDGVVCEDIDGELVLVDLAGNSWFGVAGTATDIWDALVTRAPVAQLRARLQECYPEVARERLELDLDAFLNQLIDQNLLVAVQGR